MVILSMNEIEIIKLTQNIPDELKKLKQWVLWKLEKKDGKFTKVPYQTNNNKADKTNPSEWTSFQIAIDTFTKSNGKFNGIGFVLTENDPYCFIDIDHCIDPKTKEINQWALDKIKRFNSYTEYSQSGLGFHVFVKGKIPEHIKAGNKAGKADKKKGFEIYDQAWYFCMSGNVLNGSSIIEERQTEIEQICNEIFGKTESKELPKREPSTSNLSDSEIINIIRKSKQSAKFSKLFDHGDCSDYLKPDGTPDQSSGDIALADILAFYTQDFDQIVSIMKQSALCDDKWDRVDYQRMTINKALGFTTEIYKPGGNLTSNDKSNKAGDPVTEETKAEGVPEKDSMITLSDEEIIKKASKAKNADRFNKLMAGKWKECGYTSKPQGELALCRVLAFWTRDIDQIDRLFRQSGLYSEEWEQSGSDTISKALELTPDYYTPSTYFSDKTFIPSRLANELMSEFNFIYCTGELYLYQNGVYRQMGEAFIKRECRDRLKESAKINSVNEVIAHIKDYSDIEAEKLNTHKYLINLDNGMFDIKADKLLSHSKDYLSTIRIPVSYDPSADNSIISDWLEGVLIDADCVQLAYELFGYIMIPDTTMKKAFMLVGISNTGKSTYLTVLEKFIGNENASRIPLQELSDNRFKRAELFGKLVNLFADLDNKALKSTSYFKTIVSGDTIDAERKCQNPFFFRPFSRLIFSANEIPISRDNSTAYFNRWNIMNFDKKFEGSNDKKGFAEELSKPENLSALLNCALSGLKSVLKRQSFIETEKGKKALTEYQKQNDPVGAFLETCIELEPNSRVERGELYIAYCRYCEKYEFGMDSNKGFYARIRTLKGINEQDANGGKRIFTGIKLLTS